MAQVHLRDVWKIYPGGVEAVRGFNFEIRAGEFVVLVGPSGCGKSTTLRMVAGLEEISRGEIAIDDRVVNDVHPKDRDIAMVFQNYALYPHMTVYKNMGFALRLRGIPKREIDQRVRQAASILGIEELLERKPRALSGGQRQRVALGRAIVREPKCFLFDEPLSNLDAKLRVTTRGELKALHQRLKTTTIYVTHDQEEAMTLGDRVVVMSDGLIQQAASPFHVFRHPANRFVAGFIGTPPMNFFEGRLEIGQHGPEFVTDDKTDDGEPQRLRAHLTHFDRLSGRDGRPLVLGIRPTNFFEARTVERREQIRNEGRLFRASVEVVEPLGDQMDLHLTLADDRKLTARVPAHADMPVGQDAHFEIDMSQATYFEPGEYGENLVAESEATEEATMAAAAVA